MTVHLESLAASNDIIAIGIKADDTRRRLRGTTATFVRVADATDSDAPVVIPPSAGEVRIVAAPSSRAAAIACVDRVVAGSNGVPVSGFSLADLEALSARERVPLRTLLEELPAAGLELVAEAPFDRLNDARTAIEAVNIAGLTLARLTIHQTPSVDPVSLMEAVADLQRHVAVIRAFAPLPRRVNPTAPTTGYDDLKRVAFARIIVDNVPSIQVDWSLYGPKLAQVALTMGADDLDAVSPDDHSSLGWRRAPAEEVVRNIRAAGYEPSERTGRFEPKE